MKESKWLRRLCCAAIVVLTVAVLLCGCTGKTGVLSPDDAATASDAPHSVPAADPADFSNGTALLPDVWVSDPFPYTGKYVEDGSDDEVESIAAVTLMNRSETDYQYLEFTVTTGDAVYAFSASSVHVGSTVTVLCKDRTAYAPGEVVSVECPVAVAYQTPPTMRQDLFSFEQTEGSFNVRNISGRELPGTITVYYKSTDANGWLGGITFRTVINGLAADEKQWFPAGHMGQIVFVTYEE